MRKSQSIVWMSLLTVSLMIPIGRAYAGDNPPGNHREREELRRDQRQLEDLRQQRNRELRQGDRREAREYNEKIRDKRKEIYRDRREIYGDNDGRRDRDYGWWRRDRDRDHYYD
jgi:hypothetical protein